MIGDHCSHGEGGLELGDIYVAIGKGRWSQAALTDGQIVPRSVIATQRNQVVQVGVTDLESLLTRDDQLIAVSIGLVVNLSIFNLREATNFLHADGFVTWDPA